MKTLKATLILIWILTMAAAETAVPDKQEPDWPKKLKKDDAQISIYQPQINSLDGDMLDARAALFLRQRFPLRLNMSDSLAQPQASQSYQTFPQIGRV